MKKFLILIVITLLSLAYCQKNIGGPSQSDIDQALSENLQDGSDKSQIEGFLNSNGFSYTFDNTFNRYQVVRSNFDETCFRTVLYDCGIQIYINLSEDLTYSSHEVITLYSGL
jgi:hypothetical protein